MIATAPLLLASLPALAFLGPGLQYDSGSTTAEAAGKDRTAAPDTLDSEADPLPRDLRMFGPPRPYVPPPSRGYQYPGRSFGWWDALSLVVIQSLYYVVEYTQDGPERAHWTAPVPALDTPVRKLVLARTRKRREAADHASDYFWYSSVAYPFVSTAVVPWFRGGNWRPPVMMNLINLQAFATTGLIVRMPHKWLGRTRPNAVGCAEEGEEYDEQCGSSSQLVSFPSGHTQVAMTGAGLACAHHIHGALFGNVVADGLGCGATLAAASSVGYLRMRADRHWLSDTIVGAGLGLAIGYGIPLLFYYHPFWKNEHQRKKRKSIQQERQTGLLVMPIATPSSLGVSVVGILP